MDAWHELLEGVRLSWRKHGGPASVVAAVSGGADSVALLLALTELQKREGFALSAAHADHGLRLSSGEDAAFVSALCGRLNVPCRVFRLHLTDCSEDAARQARYDALLNDLPSGSVLALAHHRRDQAETVLLHLIRGSGSAGLAGMKEWSERQGKNGAVMLWRPLLDVSPALLREALRQKGEAWREDETNAQDGYLRNFIRLRVIPAIEGRVPEAEAAMGRCARMLAEEDDYFRREADAFLKREGNAFRCGACRCLSVQALKSLHPALRRHVVRAVSPIDLDFAQTEALLAIRPGETVNLSCGWRARYASERLFFLPPEAAFPSIAPPSAESLIVEPADGRTGDGVRTQAVPRGVFERCTLRHWRTGDAIRPLGASGTKKMQDYFVDKKIPRPCRLLIPLLCDGSRVIWAVGVGPGEEARVRRGDDAVLLRFEGFLPGEKTYCQTNTEGE